MLCTQCGIDNPVSNRFCGNCGVKLEAPAASELVSESKSRPVTPPLDLRDPTDPGRIVVPANGRNAVHTQADDYVAVTEHDVPQMPLTNEPAAHAVGPVLDAPEAYRGEQEVHAEPIEPVHYMAASGDVTAREVNPPRRSTSIHGPSLLGLSDDDITSEAPVDNTDYSYLYDDDHGGGGRTVNWRLMFALLILIGFGGTMAYMWKQGKNWNTTIIHDIAGKFSGNDQKATDTKSVVGPQNNDPNTVAKVGPTTPGGPEIAVGATPSNIPASTTPQSDQTGENKAADTKNADGSKPKDDSSGNSATTPSNPLDKSGAKGVNGNVNDTASTDAKNAKPADAKSADAKAVAENDAKQAKGSDNSGDTGDEEDADTPSSAATKHAKAATSTKSAKSKKASATKSAGVDQDEVEDVALVHRADALLRARSCNQAVDLFREAALHGNATARSRLGGLYATGHCVPLDRAEAYNWFTLAKDAGARYRWIEHNRSMLWAQMSDRERERVMRR